MKRNLQMTGPGLLLCMIIAAPAWYLGGLVPVIGGPIFGILFGMIIALSFPGLQSYVLRRRYSPHNYTLAAGVRYTTKNLLQYAIILLGFEMNLFNVIKTGGQSLIVILSTLSAAFLTAFLVGKTLRLQGKKAILIGVGTSICGGSAIAATAPVIQARDEDVAHAISTIFLFNIVAVFIFPALGHAMAMSDFGFGMWAGTAINDTSSVVAAGMVWSTAAGNNNALAYATVVKLTRTMMIVPITLILAIYTGKSGTAGDGGFRFSRIFPWFILGFALMAIINTFAGIPVPVSHGLVKLGKFFIVTAMVGIGLNTNLKELITSGIKPILLGLCCWFAVACAALLVQLLSNIW